VAEAEEAELSEDLYTELTEKTLLTASRQRQDSPSKKPVLRVLRVEISAPSVTSARLGSDLDPGFDFAGG
jgi:hypothetical protein